VVAGAAGHPGGCSGVTPAIPAAAAGPARPLPATTAPLSDTTLDELAATIAGGATVAGLGESTRFAHETFTVRDQLFRRLARQHRFRALVLQDHAAVAVRLDKYVTTGEGTARSALDGAFRPWRTAEMAAALEWIREFNQDNPHDPIRILAVKPAQPQPADYDAILDHARQSAPQRLAELASHLEPIRTAHQTDEHVQRARGTHPGRPFADHARDALTIAETISGPGGGALVERMRLIVHYHENSVAGKGSHAGDAHAWAGTISAYQRRARTRVAYWDGIAHTTASQPVLGLEPEHGPRPTTGSVLRQHYGQRYVSVAIGFHHGDLGIAVAPDPAPDLIDARLAQSGQPSRWLDLRSHDMGRLWDGPAKARVISGIYDPSRDSAEYMAVASLTDAFDVLVHLHEITPTRWLP
jgi:erythromycin esterase